MVEEFSVSQALLVPLLVKFYDEGRFTNRWLKKWMKEPVTFSGSKGLGLQFDKLNSGTVVLIGGGTGINPYCDLIDLLFKNWLLEQRP
jgi:NAD(P)H-flavin reductase